MVKIKLICLKDLNLKDKPKVYLAQNRYEVNVKAFYYNDVGIAINKFIKELNVEKNITKGKVFEIHKKHFGDWDNYMEFID